MKSAVSVELDKGGLLRGSFGLLRGSIATNRLGPAPSLGAKESASARRPRSLGAPSPPSLITGTAHFGLTLLLGAANAAAESAAAESAAAESESAAAAGASR